MRPRGSSRGMRAAAGTSPKRGSRGNSKASTRGRSGTNRKNPSNHTETTRGNNNKKVRTLELSNGPLSVSNGQSINGKCERNNNNTTPPPIGSEFYLHKKFKKPTSTTTTELLVATTASICSNEPGPSCVPKCTPELNKHNTNHPIVSSHESVKTWLQNLPELSPVKHDHSTANLPSTTTSPVNLSTSTSSSATMVYKPKFRISSEPPQPIINSTDSCEPVPKSQKITPTLRLDRQSLDDRISKIIDENQTILAQTPEPLNKRMRSSWKLTSQSSVPCSSSSNKSTSQFNILSGGFTTEINSQTTPGRGLSRSFSCTEYFCGTNNGGSSVVPAGFRAAATTNNKGAGSDAILTLSSESFNSDNGPLCGSNSSNSCGEFSTSSTTLCSTNYVSPVPKKRRRLSPTPSRLCGGEVSELSSKDASVVSSTTKKYFQDVDVTVRVSNCSGAKVTIRTSNGNNNSTSECLDPVMNSMAFTRIPVDVPLESQRLLHASNNSSNNNSNNNELTLPKHLVPNKARGMVEECAAAMNLKVASSSTTEGDASKCELVITTKSSCISSSFDGALKMGRKSSGDECHNKTMDLKSSFIGGLDKVQCAQKSSGSVSTVNSVLKRPTFLSLRSGLSKKTDSAVLPSPDTPRVSKTFKQIAINGNSYTYLGFKISTRSSYTCLFKPQPMFISQDTDPKLSMYSNWQPRPRKTNELELPDLPQNDSRVNSRKNTKVIYTCASSSSKDTILATSPDNKIPITVSLVITKNSEVESTPMVKTEPKNIVVACQSITNNLPSELSIQSTLESSNKQCEQKSPESILSISTTRHKRKAHVRHVSSSSGESDKSADSKRFAGEACIKSTSSRCEEKSLPLSLTVKNVTEGKCSGESQESQTSIPLLQKGLGLDQPVPKGKPTVSKSFESTDDYTYVRGKGRGKYICDSCGIRCKKPSMLRKHLKTHTDQRPYKCTLCNFSFKTKGNLTKHEKSKSHYKRSSGGDGGSCSSSSQPYEPSGSAHSDANNTEDNDDSDEDSDSGEDNDAVTSGDTENESVEKEIAQSLLDLSRATNSAKKVESPKSKKSAILMRHHNSCSSPSIEDLSVSLSETPMDLTVKRKDENVQKSPLKKSLHLKPLGLVTEAQMWEPPESTSPLKGCLNLSKVPNLSLECENRSKPNPSSSESLEVCEVDIKPEIGALQQQLSSNSSCQGEGLKSENEESKACSSHVSIASSSNVKPPVEKVVKLHQPWLPSPESESTSSPPATENNGSSKLNTTNQTVVVETESSCDSLLKKEDSKVDPVVVLPGSNNNSVELPKGITVMEPRMDVDTMSSSKVMASVTIRPQAEFRQPSGAQALVKDEEKPECNVCGKTFARASQLTLHMNIHYLERPFRCDPCGVSFRTKGHLIKHRRSSSHDCKVYLTEAWGVANEENPRPFKCADCKIAFRIHGHLAKHLRSKMHIMRMECLGKLPFGIYFEMEKMGMNLNEIDTTDCDMSLVSLQNVAKKVYGDSWTERLTAPVEET